MQIFTSSFPPVSVQSVRYIAVLTRFWQSKDYESFLRTHIERCNDPGIRRYCLRHLSMISAAGCRHRSLNAQEVQAALRAPSSPSIFGETLERIYSHQIGTTAANLAIPLSIVCLANAIIECGGLRTEGIFRLAADVEALQAVGHFVRRRSISLAKFGLLQMKLRFDSGDYYVDQRTDPSVPAGLFKLLLRDLAEPLVPTDLYYRCIEQAKERHVYV